MNLLSTAIAMLGLFLLQDVDKPAVDESAEFF